MNSYQKAAVKTFVVFVALFIALVAIVKNTNLKHILYNSDLSKVPQEFSIISTFTFGFISACFAYDLAKRKHRKALARAAICFFTNLWGLIYLAFLPLADNNIERHLNNR